MYTIEQIIENLPELEHHSAANLPMMQDSKLEGLKFDMLENGMHSPIYIVNGQILDGRARYETLRWLKERDLLTFDPKIEEWTRPQDDLSSVVFSLNIHRNDYDKNQLAAYAALHLVPKLKGEALVRMYKKAPKELFPQVKGTANALAALQVGTNEKYVQYANRIIEVNPNDLRFVMNKQMTLLQGLEYIKMKPDKRGFFFEQMKVGKEYGDVKKAYLELNKSETELTDSDKEDQTNEKQSEHITTPSNAKQLLSKASPVHFNFKRAISQALLEDIIAVLHKHGCTEEHYEVQEIHTLADKMNETPEQNFSLLQ